MNKTKKSIKFDLEDEPVPKASPKKKNEKT